MQMAIFLAFGILAGAFIKATIYDYHCMKLLSMPLYTLTEVIVTAHL